MSLYFFTAPQLQWLPVAQGVCCEHQCPCNNPAVSESNSWWWRSDSSLFPSPADGGDSDVTQTGDRRELAGAPCCSCLGGELKLWVAWWSSAWPEGDGDSYIFNGCLGVLTQLLVTAHPTCHGTGPTSPSNRPSFRHLNNLVHVFTERWQSQVHWPLYTSPDE